MATRDELDLKNANSRSRQRASRAQNALRREVRQKERAGLSAATSTSERREVKAWAEQAYEGAVYDLNTGYNPRQNKTDYESDIGQRGVDQFTAPEATPASTSGDGLPDGYGPEEYTVCVNGAPVTRNFLTDNPD